MISLVAGDTLISSKRFLESLLVLSKNTRKQHLLPVLHTDTSFRASFAYFIESLVLHERVFCTFNETLFSSLIQQTELPDISELVQSIPLQPLYKELEDKGNINLGQIQHGYDTVNNDPMIIVSEKAQSLFKFNFPDLAKKHDSRKPIMLQQAVTRHFLYYENVTSLAMGIAYALLSQASEKTHLPDVEAKSGYKIYGEKTLFDVDEAVKEKAQELNSWITKSIFRIEAPLVFSYVVEKASERKSILSAAIEVRNSKEAVAFRRKCAQFDKALIDDDTKLVADMIKEIKDTIGQLSQKLEGPKINLSISFPLSISISPLEILDYIRNYGRKRHLNFISQIAEVGLHSQHAYQRFHTLL